MSRPPRPRVASPSTHIAGHSYDTARKELTVHFKNGSSYRYDKVPAKTASEFGAAESRGTFLHKHIRPHHTGTKITD